MLSNKKIFVTGGAGFIGSHLADRLLKEKYKVAVIDNLSTGKKQNLNSKAKFYKLDIQSQKIAEVFRKEKPDIVFHFAAQIDVRKSIESPIKDAEINILGTLNILENCKKYKVKKFIFPSSVGVYGNSKNLPIKEEFSLNSISPYPVTKLAIEKYLNYYQSQGLSYTCLRYSNIYGPRQSAKGEGGVIALFFNKILSGDRPIIYGDGKQTRDFLYVDDAVEAAIKAINAPSGSVYNIGRNKEVTISELVELMSNIFKKDIHPIFKPFRQGEILKSRVSYSKAKKELKWQPKYGLSKGLKQTAEWFEKVI